MANDEFLIPDDDPKTPVRVTIPAADGAKPVVVTAAEPTPAGDEVASLKRQVEEANARTETERRERTRIEAEANTAKTEAKGERLIALSSQVETLERDLKVAKSDYAQLMAAGDYEKAADAQEKIATLSYDRRMLEAQKSEAEVQYQRPTTEGRVQPQVTEPSRRDAYEKLVGDLKPKSSQWLREHPDAFYKQGNKLAAAHQAAVELEGLEHESPEYFSYIEQRLGLSKEPTFSAEDPPRRSEEARSAAMTAPPARQAPSLSGRRPAGPRTVELTPEMQRIAADMDMTPQEYAEHMLGAQDEGKLIRH